MDCSPFLRDEAMLVLVYVSDEEDQSPSAVNLYVDLFRGLKHNNPDLIRGYAIVGPDPAGCSSIDGDAMPGTRYIDTAMRLGGMDMSICELDYGPLYTDIINDIVEPKRRFVLGAAPVITSLEVHVGGELAYRGTGPNNGDYYYDAATNAIVFSFTSVPPAGEIIVVNYQIACLH